MSLAAHPQRGGDKWPNDVGARFKRINPKIMVPVMVGLILVGVAAWALSSYQRPLNDNESSYLLSVTSILTEFENDRDSYDSAAMILNQGIPMSSDGHMDPDHQYGNALEQAPASLKKFRSLPARLEALSVPDRFSEAQTQLLKAANEYSELARGVSANSDAAIQKWGQEEMGTTFPDSMTIDSGAITDSASLRTLRRAADGDYSEGLGLLDAATP